jgi:hypothetical protein
MPVTTLAHGSGIDEAIAVLVPLVAVIVMLRLGAKKAPPEEEPGAEAAPSDEA